MHAFHTSETPIDCGRRGARPAATLLLAALLTTLAPASGGQEPASEPPSGGIEQRLVHEGIAIDVAMRPIDGDPDGFVEGDPVSLTLEITDSHTGEPLSSLYPAAWLDLLPSASSPDLDGPNSCQDKVEAFVGGALLAQPEVDLNVYHVLALNDEATISVVDPLFGFGGSKLLDMVFLSSPGDDWELTEDQRWLFVSMPDSNQVAVVETATWQVVANVDVGPAPRRLALQGDERILWVEWQAGVSAIDTGELREIARLETGRGRHELALTGDDRTLFVSNELSGTVSIVDVDALAKVRDLETGRRPLSLAWSSKSRALYVTHPDGSIVVIDGAGRQILARSETEPGIGRIRFAPDDRLAFVVNPERDAVHIFDAAAGRVVQTADVEDGPYEVAFSDELAYVAHRGNETVLMIPLGGLGREGAPVPVIDFPGGQHPPGKTGFPASAETMVQAPGATAVLVANPPDGVIYYYKEGMAAPMGHFKNYGRMPRAVEVVDRSLRETAPGVYETAAKILEPGKYELAVFIDSPRVIRCFGVDVAPTPERLAADRAKQRVAIRPLDARRKLAVGESVSLSFELTSPATGELRTGLRDVNVLTFLSPGVWQKRQWAKEVDRGVYQVDFAPSRPGVYFVFLQVESLGLGYNRSRAMMVEVVRPEAS